jgi:putative tryptophan/tyrosine transport system substrate-binding protein
MGASFSQGTNAYWLALGIRIQGSWTFCRRLCGRHAGARIQGRDFEMVSRYAEGIQDRLKTLAEEIVGLKPNVIVAAAVNAAVPARSATSVIPIVCPALADAVHLGLIASEARPGGNVTATRKPRRSAKNWSPQPRLWD